MIPTSNISDIKILPFGFGGYDQDDYVMKKNKTTKLKNTANVLIGGLSFAMNVTKTTRSLSASPFHHNSSHYYFCF